MHHHPVSCDPGHQRRIYKKRYVLLDRDGTLNEDAGYLSDPGALKLLPGTLEGLLRLQNLGLGLVVITNQSAIGRGYFDKARLESIHRRLKELLAAGGVRLDGIYYCPHMPEENCPCRKPAPGLALQASAQLGFRLDQCLVIGDQESDMELGRRLSAITFLMRSGHQGGIAPQGRWGSDYVVGDIMEAATVIEQLLVRGGP